MPRKTGSRPAADGEVRLPGAPHRTAWRLARDVARKTRPARKECVRRVVDRRGHGLPAAAILLQHCGELRVVAYIPSAGVHALSVSSVRSPEVTSLLLGGNIGQ